MSSTIFPALVSLFKWLTIGFFVGLVGFLGSCATDGTLTSPWTGIFFGTMVAFLTGDFLCLVALICIKLYDLYWRGDS